MSTTQLSPVVWSPQPRQTVALSCPSFELFYGGARGGGKSDFLLADFLKEIGRGGSQRGVLFRRTYPELEELLKRSQEIYPYLGATYSESKRTWTFPSGGTLKFRHLQRDADVHYYQGHQYSWIGFDELTNWPTDYCYVYMQSCARSADGVPVRIRASGNPGSVGHAWVRERFIDEKEPERIYTHPETGLTIAFVPALLDDNIRLMKNDPDYEKRLLSLPPHLVRAYRYGDWDVFAGQVFEEFRRSTHAVKPFPIPPNWTRFASMDWGYQRPFSIGWWVVDPDGRLIRYREWYGCEATQRNVGIKMAASDVAKKAWELSILEGCDAMVADPACWSKIDDSPSIADKFAAAGWKLEKADNDRTNGMTRLHDLMKYRGEDGRPMLLVFDTCTAFLRTIPTLVSDPRKPEDIDTTGEDHQYDESRYAAMSKYAKRPEMYRPRTSLPQTRKGTGYDVLRHGLRKGA